MAISNDGDALGKVAHAIELAQALKARIELPEKTSRTAIVAQPAALTHAKQLDAVEKAIRARRFKASAGGP